MLGDMTGVVVLSAQARMCCDWEVAWICTEVLTYLIDNERDEVTSRRGPLFVVSLTSSTCNSPGSDTINYLHYLLLWAVK